MKDSLSHCSDCQGTVDHCHGTLIVHPDGVVECMDEQCVQLHAVRHAFVVDCSALSGGCSCDDAIRHRRAS